MLVAILEKIVCAPCIKIPILLTIFIVTWEHIAVNTRRTIDSKYPKINKRHIKRVY